MLGEESGDIDVTEDDEEQKEEEADLGSDLLASTWRLVSDVQATQGEVEKEVGAALGSATSWPVAQSEGELQGLDGAPCFLGRRAGSKDPRRPIHPTLPHPRSRADVSTSAP